MKVYRVTMLVIPLNGAIEDADHLCDEINNARYANDCIAPDIQKVESAEIGEWHDGHPLNNSKTSDAAIAALTFTVEHT